jgi:hypothetical protein
MKLNNSKKNPIRIISAAENFPEIAKPALEAIHKMKGFGASVEQGGSGEENPLYSG